MCCRVSMVPSDARALQIEKEINSDLTQFRMGLCHIFIQHTSASLTINEVRTGSPAAALAAEAQTASPGLAWLEYQPAYHHQLSPVNSIVTFLVKWFVKQKI